MFGPTEEQQGHGGLTDKLIVFPFLFQTSALFCDVSCKRASERKPRQDRNILYPSILL